MLSLDRQNKYRGRYRRLRRSWRPIGELYEATSRDHLAPNSRVLDLGCGRGGLPESLSLEHRKLFGLDCDWPSLAQYRACGVHLIAGLAGRLPLSGQSFDLVLSSWTLEHLDDPVTVLNEVWRVLRPGGYCVFITPNIRNPLLLAGRLVHTFPSLYRRLVETLYARDRTDIFGVYYRANTVRRLRRLAHASRLRLCSLDVVPDPTYLAFNEVTFRMAAVLEHVMPSCVGIHLLGLLQKV